MGRGLALVRPAAFAIAAATAAWTSPGESGCPEGSYRSVPIVFACGGATGIAHVVVPPSATADVVNISRGVRYFRVMATSNESVDLRLYDSAGGKYIVAGHQGAVNDQSRSGTYEGVGIVFSGDEASQEHLYVLGALRRRAALRLHNRAAAWATVSLNYSYDGHERCPQIPDGCSAYNATAALAEVDAWSRWAQARYATPKEAWRALGAPHAEPADEGGGVRWHRWPAVWHARGGAAASAPPPGTSWQEAFRYVDADDDGEASRAEFEEAFRLHGSSLAAGVSAGEPSKLRHYLKAGALVLALSLGTLLGAWLLCRCCRARGSKRPKQTRGLASGALDEEEPPPEVLLGAAPEEEAVPAEPPRGEQLKQDEGDAGLRLPGLSGLGGFGAVPWTSMGIARSAGTAAPAGGAGWGGLWPSALLSWPPAQPAPAFRYGPLPSSEEHAAPGRSFGPAQPTSPLASSRSFASSLPRASHSFSSLAGPGSRACGGSATVPAHGALAQQEPVASGLLSRGASASVPAGAAAPATIHVQERSLSFSTAVVEDTGQTVPAVTTVQRSYSFTRAQPSTLAGAANGGRAGREEVEAVRTALHKQAPWAAVFTPEEWAQTSHVMRQGQQRGPACASGAAQLPPLTLLQLQP